MEKKEKIHKKIYKAIIKKLYIGYGVRLFLNTILYIIFLCLGITFIFFAFDFKEQKIINYTEKSNLDYKVYLKQNDFYDTEYLEKDMLYIASLIDKVNIEFYQSSTPTPRFLFYSAASFAASAISSSSFLPML